MFSSFWQLCPKLVWMSKLIKNSIKRVQGKLVQGTGLVILVLTALPKIGMHDSITRVSPVTPDATSSLILPWTRLSNRWESVKAIATTLLTQPLSEFCGGRHRSAAKLWNSWALAVGSWTYHLSSPFNSSTPTWRIRASAFSCASRACLPSSLTSTR